MTADDENDALAEAYNRGLDLEKAGDLDGAEAAYREVLVLDPDDHGGVSVRLAAMGRLAAPERAPDAYVATLFDQNAVNFDDMLVDQLGYAVPMMVREKLEPLAPGPYPKLLDLGCGTGLTGVSLADWCEHVTGVDLSEAMLDEAHERGVYDDLYVAEACDFLEGAEDGPWDMIAATDVLPYIGDLSRFFAGCAGQLRPGGLLVVSCESEPDQVADYLVGAKHRFAHARGYLSGLLESHGFASLAFDPITVRYDEGAPVPGYLVVARIGAPGDAGP
ncbi:MAG: methyltransferase domain-containing protein [Pseudomonadota bacterium]